MLGDIFEINMLITLFLWTLNDKTLHSDFGFVNILLFSNSKYIFATHYYLFHTP